MGTPTDIFSRRAWLSGAVSASALAAAGPAVAQAEWPSRIVRVIVPYPAGGSTDVLTRILAERLKDKLGQSWVVENRPGAGGNIGIDAVAKSEPDGYTIGAATVGHSPSTSISTARCPTMPIATLRRCR